MGCKINQAQGDIGSIVQNKFKTVAKKNPGLSEMKKVRNILAGKTEIIDLLPSVVSSMKFSPLTTVEVEKGFLVEKANFSDTDTDTSLIITLTYDLKILLI